MQLFIDYLPILIFFGAYFFKDIYFATAVLMESYISYLGYGIQPPLASWGNMLTNAQAYFDTVPFLAILPGVMITLTVLSFNFLGDGLRDALDSKLKMDL